MGAEEGFSDGFRKLDDLVLTLKGLVLVRSGERGDEQDIRDVPGGDQGRRLLGVLRQRHEREV